MKIILGVDSGGLYQRAVSFISKLNFPLPNVTRLHAVESVMTDGGFPTPGSGMLIGNLMSELKEVGRKELEAAEAKCIEANLNGDSDLAFGDPARCLIERAEVDAANLIAVGSERKGLWGSLFLGSVSKGLLIGAPCSVLVSKQNSTAEPLRVVFATDHSEYARRCLDLILSLAPSGIAEIHVLYVEDREMLAISNLSMEFPSQVIDTHDDLMPIYEQRNAEVAASLQKLAPSVTHKIMTGHPNEVIGAHMKATGSQLLMMGAQGHGFLERIALGSKSYHQVISEPYSVFILRP